MTQSAGRHMPVFYTKAEEIANALTHGVGAALAIAALVTGIAFAKGATGVVSAALFGGSMVVLYLVSTLYHAIPHAKAKAILRVMDHGAIYLLIAGSYTPFCLMTLHGTTGIVLLAVVWSIALIGAFAQPWLMKAGEWINCALYLGLGWCVVFVAEPLFAALPTGGLWLLAAGGITYSAGVVFYLWDRLPFNHAVWHVFVIAGTALQFFCVLFYVLPGTQALAA